MLSLLPHRERDTVREGGRAAAPVKSVDEILVPAGHIQRFSVRAERKPQKDRGEWNSLQHSSRASFDYLYSLFSPSIEQHDDAILLGRERHCERHRAEIVRDAGGIESGSGGKTADPGRGLRRHRGFYLWGRGATGAGNERQCE